MPTDRMTRGLLALGTIALLGAAPPATAQEPLVLDPAAAAAVETNAPAAVQRGGTIRLRGDRTVAADEVIEGSIVVFNGTLTVAGEVRGDATVGRGELRLLRGAVVGGDAIVTGGRLVNEGARVGGEMRAEHVAAAPSEHAGSAATRVRLRSPFALFGGGTGLAQTVGLGLLLALVGIGMIFYGSPQLSRLSDTVRGEGFRAAGIGVAALCLALPAFILGAVALALTIIGIPLLLLYVPLFWVSVVTLGVVGVVVVAHAVGERTSEQRAREGDVPGNRHTFLFTGLAVILAPVLLADVLRMTGILGFAGELVAVMAWLGLFLAACVGAGAVLLQGSRAWRHRRFRRAMGLDAPGGTHAAQG
jgi:hypothetical protein